MRRHSDHVLFLRANRPLDLFPFARTIPSTDLLEPLYTLST